MVIQPEDTITFFYNYIIEELYATTAFSWPKTTS